MHPPHPTPPPLRRLGRSYHWAAVVAETYVFVYLGMAVFTFPIFEVGCKLAPRTRNDAMQRASCARP